MTYDDAQLVDRDDPVDDEGRCRLCKRPWPAPPEDDADEGDDCTLCPDCGAELRHDVCPPRDP